MLKTSTITDQVAAYLEDGLRRRQWTGQMPGRSKLADELGVNVKTVERALAQTWIVVAAARPVLESLAKSPVSVFALFGRLWELEISGGGPEKDSALKETVQRLTDLGHQRIVLLTRRERRQPDYGPIEKLFLEELEARGISSGAYNIPEWEESAEGLRECLDDLFRFTPPSAIIVSDSALCLAIKNYLASNRGRDLRNVAMVCTDYHSNFNWCAPEIAHFSWDPKPLIKHVVRWVNNVAAGKDDRRQKLVPVQFVGGEALKPVEVGVS